MKKFLIGAALSCILLSACEEPSRPLPNPDDFYKHENPEDYRDDSILEAPQTPVTGRDNYISDLVLLYGGSSHRVPERWTDRYLNTYLTYTDSKGSTKWLFDGFLLLEFMMTQYSRTLITGYQYNGVYLQSATKQHWQALIDYYFDKNSGIPLLDKCVGVAAGTYGKPSTKRKVLIGIPEPIQYLDSHTKTGGTRYWGQLADKDMDFSNSFHRALAVKWFVSQIITRFEAAEFENVELAGFYWVAEKATHSRDIITDVASYIKAFGYAFSWIPYYTADGYSDWAGFGFTQAYLQPNYFFNTTVPFSRLESAISDATKANMGMEIEFDGNAMASNGSAYRLRDYMSEFKKYGVWEKCPLAYYQGSWALKWLRDSSNSEDKQLYNEFCEWVVSRPTRK